MKCSSHTPVECDIAVIRNKLVLWFNENKRDLPWRMSSTLNLPYRVLVSEIMLQQTRVDTVINYFNRWMDKWPSLQDLSKADLDAVHSVWSGLGYYTRATRLYQLAKTTKMIPATVSDLLVLPGIGPYTAGAVSSIAFGRRAPIVDGNVTRVLSRLFALGGDSTKSFHKNHVWYLADLLVCPNHPGDFNQGLMDLGATVCTPKYPNCAACPLSAYCSSFNLVSKKISLSNHDDCAFFIDMEDFAIDTLPIKPKKGPSRVEYHLVLVMENCENQYYLEKNPKTGVLANLYEFPHKAVKSPQTKGITTILNQMAGETKLCNLTSKGSLLHKFSHIDRHLLVHYSPVRNTDGYCGVWKTKPEISNMNVAATVRKVLDFLEKSEL